MIDVSKCKVGDSLTVCKYYQGSYLRKIVRMTKTTVTDDSGDTWLSSGLKRGCSERWTRDIAWIYTPADDYRLASDKEKRKIESEFDLVLFGYPADHKQAIK